MEMNKTIKMKHFQALFFNKMKNKKAQTSNTIIMSISWFFFLIVVLLSVTFLVKGYLKTTIDIKDIEAELFYQEILFTNNGITYQDEITGRNYPGIIDLNRFNNEDFTKSLSYGKNNYFMSANLSLSSKDGTKIKSFVYNKEWYKKWKPLAKTFLPGTGGAKIIQKKSYVLVKKEELTFPAILYVEIVYPNK